MAYMYDNIKLLWMLRCMTAETLRLLTHTTRDLCLILLTKLYPLLRRHLFMAFC